MPLSQSSEASRRLWLAALSGLVVGVLGGLIGLGGAEFRLPLLLGLFSFPALEAVIVNKATSLLVVASGLVFRSQAVPQSAVWQEWPVIATLLAGGLPGAWLGAEWATRLGASFHRVIALLLVLIALVLLLAHEPHSVLDLAPATRTIAGVVAGFGIGVVASLLGVAGGELLIPTLVLLFGLELKLAGSVSLAVSLPTMVAGFARYSQDQAFGVLRAHAPFVIALAAGSLVGVAIGGQLARVVSTAFLLPVLAAVLLVSAVRIWRHRP